jgi:hypothetical protein
MARRDRIDNTFAIEPVRSFTYLPSAGRALLLCKPIPAAARALGFALLLCLGNAYGGSQQQDQQATQQGARQPAPQGVKQAAQQGAKQGAQQGTPQNDQQQMRGLDEQIQEIKSDVLSITAELSQLEEKLLYPSGTQVAIFVALAKDDKLRLDAVQLKIDGQLAAHYIYSFKELEALRKGGVQRLYVGNVATGEHQLEVVVDGKLEGGADFTRTGQFAFRKEVKPKLVGLTLAGSNADNSITLGEW